jgi:hypothetical protein
MIAARQIAFGGSAKRWENPYITDGLVAMWDGEWNAGWGVHDANATVWKDLVGGNESSNITSLWGNDHLKLMRVNGEKCSLTLPQTSDARVIEMCAQLLEGTSNTGRYYSTDDNFRVEVDTNNMTQARASYTLQSGSLANRWFAGNVDCSKIITTTFTISDQESSFYINGSLVRKVNNYPPATALLDSVTLILGEYRNTSRSNMNIFCVRVMNRLITAEEIANNYEIDKARFGL